MSDLSAARRNRLGLRDRHHLTVSPMQKPHDVAGVGVLFDLVGEVILKRREVCSTDEPLGLMLHLDHAKPKLS